MTMNVLVTLDSNYVLPLCNMLESMLASNSGASFKIYVAHSSLNKSDFSKIKKSCRNFSAQIISIQVPDYLFEGAPKCKRITKETYYRIFAPLYLPEDVERVLYIDPDTLVINSLNNFYNVDFGNAYYAGAGHFTGLIDRWNKFRLSLKKSRRYINAGVLMMNIKALRENFSERDLFDFIKKYEKILFLADQDVINKYYDGKILVFDPVAVNLDERTFSNLLKRFSKNEAFEVVKNHTVIIHYDGKNKPWKKGYKGDLGVFYKNYATLFDAEKKYVCA